MGMLFEDAEINEVIDAIDELSGLRGLLVERRACRAAQ